MSSGGSVKGSKGHINEAFESTEKENEIEKKDRSSSSSSSSNGEQPEGEERAKWGNSIEFLLSCISMSVGLGNVWRFPFVAYDNGGGAFLIPYFIVLIIIGRPLYFLEMVIGQFSSSGTVKIWNVAPLAKGIGYGQAIATWCVSTYYSYLMALSFFYLFCSFENPLPWSYCNDKWSTNETCYDSSSNFSDPTVTTENKTSSSEAFFNDYVLYKIDNIDNGIGPLDWRLSLCLLLSWICIFGALIKGVASSGKVAYFTAIFPYVVLITLLIRGCTLPGAGDGILFFITPQWEKLLDVNVWYAAVTQCFFSLSAGFGAVTTYASYNPFRHRIYRDSTIVSLADTGTSILAGVTIFAILGNLAVETNQDIEDVVFGGPGLAFVSYPAAISKFDAVPQLFAVLFFLMLITLAIGSIMGQTGVIVTILCDEIPKAKRWMVTLIACTATFLISLMYATPGGLYMLDLVDYYGAGFVIYVMVIAMTIIFCWVYGLEQVVKDIRFMLGFGVGIYWKLTWGIVLPLGLLIIFVYAMVVYQPLVTDNGEFHPIEATIAGWILSAIAIFQIPIWGFIGLRKQRGSTTAEKLKSGLQPSEEWGPANAKLKQQWLDYNRTDVFFSWVPRHIRQAMNKKGATTTVTVTTDTVTVTTEQKY